MTFRDLCARLVVALVLLAPAPFAWAQSSTSAATDPQRTVTVGVYVNPPFIIKSGALYEGVAFDLFQQIARTERWAVTYVDYATVNTLLEATRSGAVDIAIGNLTVTRARAETVDFTYAWHDGGLRIMTDGDGPTGFDALLGELGSPSYLRAYAWLVMFVFGATVLLTLFDRRFDEDFPSGWMEGLAESFYQIMSIATNGSASRKPLFGTPGKVFSAIWLICGVAVLAYVTSSVTSIMTMAAVDDQIQSVADLQDKTIGVLDGGASELYATSHGLATRSFESLEVAIAALRADTIDAMIGDEMVLKYHIHHVADAGLNLVGPLFDPEKYAFATPLGSPFTRPLSLDVMTAHENGIIATLESEYLGADS